MTEILLNAIIHIFAVFTFRRGRRFTSEARKLLEFYLAKYLGLSATRDTYLGLFDDFLDIYEAVPRQGEELDGVVANIAAQLKKQLPRREQYICLLLFADLASRAGRGEPAGGPDSDVRILAEAFAVATDVVADIQAFCLYPEDHERLPERFAVLSSQPPPNTRQCRTLVKPDFKGRFTLWYAEEIDGFFIRAGMDSCLLMAGAPLVPGRFYWMPSQATLHDPQWRSVTHGEISALFLAKARGVRFDGENLDFRYPGSDNGLHNFSFSARGGEMVAVMGGSGAGKSTLLGLLNGTMALDSGTLRINGMDFSKNPAAFQGAIGYVPQDDLLFEDLTVYENLYYCARFCLAKRPEGEIRERVATVLRDLGQLETRDLKVGTPLDKTISGGQRKRLNIALELIREPAILFVDEPTSGLSSSDSETVMSLLKAQAIKGNLVFVVIHQPSSRIFKMFDRLWILDKGGRPVYDGNPLDGLVYFQSEIQQAGMEEYACPQCGNVTPEQIFAILEAKRTDEAGQFTDQRKISPEAWHRRFLEHTPGKAPDPLPSPDSPGPEAPEPGLPELRRPGRLEQFGIYFSRNLKSKLADKNYLAINLLEPLVLALFIGGLTRGTSGGEILFRDNSHIGVFFFISVIVSLFLGLSVSAEEINRDRKILVREKFLQLSRLSYLSAKTAYLALVCAIQTALYVGVANSLAQVPDMAGATFWMLFTCGMVSSILGLNISATLSRAVSIYILIPMLLIPQMLLCGVVIDFDHLIHRDSGNRYTPFLADIMPSRWGVEALLVHQYTTNRYMERFLDPTSQKQQAEYMLDYYLPELHSASDFLFILEKPGDWESQARRNLATLARESTYLSGITGLENPLEPGDFNPGTFTREKSRALRGFLDGADDFFTKQRRSAMMEISRIKKAVRDPEKGITAKSLKERYTNVSVERFALNQPALEGVRHSGLRMVQLIYPVSRIPDNSWGRAHFMAPQKKIGSIILSTYGFNCLVLWLMGALLFAALYLDLLSRTGKMITQGFRWLNLTKKE